MIANKTRLKRLNHFITVLKAVPAKKFDLDVWRDRNFFDEPQKVKVPDNFVKVDCKTVACALGWAALDKSFNRQGLTFKEDNIGCLMPDGKRRWNIHAGRHFFGITEGEAEDLFYQSNYAVMLKKRADKLVDKGQLSSIHSYEYDGANVKTGDVIRKLRRLIKHYEKV